MFINFIKLKIERIFSIINLTRRGIKLVRFKKAQVSVEYLMVIGFVTFVTASVLILAYLYSAIAKDKIAMDQIEVFAQKIISSAEAVYYAGEPSQITVTGYLPNSVQQIEIEDKAINFNISTSSGGVYRSFSSKVALSGAINAGAGIKNLKLKAEYNKVIIS